MIKTYFRSFNFASKVALIGLSKKAKLFWMDGWTNE